MEPNPSKAVDKPPLRAEKELKKLIIAFGVTKNPKVLSELYFKIQNLVDERKINLSKIHLLWDSRLSGTGSDEPEYITNRSNTFIFMLIRILKCQFLFDESKANKSEGRYSPLYDDYKHFPVFCYWYSLMELILDQYLPLSANEIITRGAEFRIDGIDPARDDKRYAIKMIMRYPPILLAPTDAEYSENKEAFDEKADRNAQLIMLMFKNLSFDFKTNQMCESHLYTALHENKRHCFEFLVNEVGMKFDPNNDRPALIHVLAYDLKHPKQQESKMKFLKSHCNVQNNFLDLDPNQTDFMDKDLSSKDRREGTALHFAITKNIFMRKEIIAFLQYFRVDPFACDKHDKKGIDMIIEEKIPHVEDKLKNAIQEQNGYDINKYTECLKSFAAARGRIENWMRTVQNPHYHNRDDYSVTAQAGSISESFRHQRSSVSRMPSPPAQALFSPTVSPYKHPPRPPEMEMEEEEEASTEAPPIMEKKAQGYYDNHFSPVPETRRASKSPLYSPKTYTAARPSPQPRDTSPMPRDTSQAYLHRPSAAKSSSPQRGAVHVRNPSPLQEEQTDDSSSGDEAVQKQDADVVAQPQSKIETSESSSDDSSSDSDEEVVLKGRRRRSKPVYEKEKTKRTRRATPKKQEKQASTTRTKKPPAHPAAALLQEEEEEDSRPSSVSSRGRTIRQTQKARESAQQKRHGSRR